MTHILASWALALMVILQPEAPWRSTYASTAAAFARSAVAEPLFDGPDAEARTAALLVAVAWYESRFNPRAVDPPGTAYCLGQIDASNHRALGVTRALLLDDVDACVGAMSHMLRDSLRICRRRPLIERLGWYHLGGPTCRPSRKGEQRMRLAGRLLDGHRAELAAAQPGPDDSGSVILAP